MNGRTPILDSGTPPSLGRRRIRVGIITGLIGGFLIFVQVVNVDEKAKPSSDVGTAVLVFGAALGFVILIHELGHLVAGWLMGFRFSHIRVGPLRLYLNNGKLNIGLLWETTALGDTAMWMEGIARLRRRLIVYVLGGAGAIALSVPITVVLANRSSFASMYPFAVSFAAEFTFISIILTIVNLMPAPLGSRSATDGSRLATLLSDRKRGRRYLAICAVQAQQHKGVHPRNWKRTWLKAASCVSDNSIDDLWGNWLAYKCASARSDKHDASAHLETCLGLSRLQTQTVRGVLLQEAAFFSAWFLQNMPLANKWLAQVKMRHGMPLLTRLRLDIATHCSRNEFCEALRIWETMLAQLQALPEIEARGTLLRDWLDFGDQIQVRQSEAAAAAVPVEQDRLSDIYDKLGVFAPVADIRTTRISLRPLTPWLIASTCLSFLAFVLATSKGNKLWVHGLGAIYYSCLIGLLWIMKRYLVFETLRGPSTRWYLPWTSARFSIQGNACILVRDIDSVTPWYVDQLGLFKAGHIRLRECEMATYKFKEDGKTITLTTRITYGTDKSLRLFTKRISRMKEVLSERGIDIGPIQQDRQGTRYFEIHDPEGNVIEVVEEA